MEATTAPAPAGRGARAGEGALGFTVTLLAMVLTGAAILLVWWGMRRPWRPGRVPFVPLELVQFLLVVLLLMFAGHLVTLLSGRPFLGRLG
ncbi:MAG: hypothetical protein D6757_06130 [Alphaproteobacteria bacterium]|nr:MAG: hypothetical protein D6757_06130 [Alphaproteobacteria bacterium]